MELVQEPSVRLYRSDIDGIRAIAILSVVLYHAGVPQVPGGFTGVDIFFVISGYLIGGHIYSDLLSGSFSYLHFYRLRAKRILPAFFAMLAFTIVVALVLLSPFEAWEFSKSAVAATLSASNIYFWRHTNYFDTQNVFNPLLMTWSLGVEEQFYAVIPVLLVLLARIRRNLILPAVLTICVLSFLLSWRELGSHPFAVFYLLPTRAWELGVGIALAIAELRRKRTIVPESLVAWVSLTGLLLMLAPMVLLMAASPFPGAAALPSVLGTALIIVTPTSWMNRRLLSLAPLVFIGKVSYSWYLWHWPILSFLRIISGGTLPPGIVALAITASLGVAITSYFFIEQPFRRSGRAPAPLLLRYALVSIAFLAALVVIWRTHGIPQRYPQLVQIDSTSSPLQSDPCHIGSGNDKPNLSPSCYSASWDRPVVALWGDSHALVLAPDLRAIANTAGYDFVELSKGSCLPLTGAARYSLEYPQPLASDCMRFNHSVLDRLKSDKAIRIVILAGYWVRLSAHNEWWITDTTPQRAATGSDESRKVFIQSLGASIQSLQKSGKQVILMDDVPNFDFDPRWIVRTARIPIRQAVAKWLGMHDISDLGFAHPGSDATAILATSLLHESLATSPGAELVDIKHALCNDADQCIYRKEDSMLYRNDSHLTPYGAEYALRDFRIPTANP